MPNGLKNCGFLDGTANWTGASGATLAVDEDALGGPGRAVLKASGTVDAVTAYSDAVGVSVGQVVEAFGGIAASAGTVALSIEWLDGSSAHVATTALPIVAQASGLTVQRGLPSRFARAYGRAVAPSSAAHARLVMTATHTGGSSHWGALLKPFLAALGTPAPAYQSPWDPGAHDNVDLNLPVWPSEVGRFDAGGQIKPASNIAAYNTDANIDINSVLYQDVEWDWTARVRCTRDQQDAIDAFYAARMTGQSPTFYVVRADTDQLCFAHFIKDGQPRPVDGRGPTLMVEMGLHLGTA